MTTPTTSRKTYYFLKTAEGHYLQANLNMRTGEWTMWLDYTHTHRGLTNCHPTPASAESYRAHAATLGVEGLLLVEEVL
jgi:hypothetical protein